MKKGMFTFLVVMAGLLMFSSCTSVHKTMREPNARVEFEKDDFTFSEQLSASATSTMILTIDWQRIFKQETASVDGASMAIDISMIPVVGNMVVDKTANYALYELMKKNPGWDVVFYPQFETKIEKPVLGIGFIYKTSTVTTTARLAKIK
ncbi:MAG: hypothetical protein R6V49_03025 [Bacteroidales bacterium]